jgi:hypothetical protein
VTRSALRLRGRLCQREARPEEDGPRVSHRATLSHGLSHRIGNDGERRGMSDTRNRITTRLSVPPLPSASPVAYQL